ncbi:MAG: hypothetical protein V7L26_17650 [Nostoc sp.]|uniref:hypothetical protein n=1 Tax=Nostoc sp. TaxID=1180 RepID=UPI002FF4B7D1
MKTPAQLITEERQRAGGRGQKSENIIFALSNQGFRASKFIYGVSLQHSCLLKALNNLLKFWHINREYLHSPMQTGVKQIVEQQIAFKEVKVLIKK